MSVVLKRKAFDMGKVKLGDETLQQKTLMKVPGIIFDDKLIPSATPNYPCSES